MKEIKAFIRRDKLTDVIGALRAAGVRSVTVVPVIPVGIDAPLDFIDISMATPIEHVRQIAKLELVCRDREFQTYADVIRRHAWTGERGDGLVFVSAVDDAVRIRTGAEGDAAL